MKGRNPILWTIVLASMLVVLAAVGVYFWPNPQPGKDYYDRIHIGMSFADVRKLMRGSGFRERTDLIGVRADSVVYYGPQRMEIALDVDDAGKVVDKHWSYESPEETRSARFWRRLTFRPAE